MFVDARVCALSHLQAMFDTKIARIVVISDPFSSCRGFSVYSCATKQLYVLWIYTSDEVQDVQQKLCFGDRKSVV